MDEFNIWDLERVHIKIDIKVLQTINEKIFSRFKTKRKAYFKIFDKKEIPFDTFRNLLKYSYIKDFFVPLKIYLRLIDNLNISRKDVQNNIIAYKTGKGKNYIIKPILPIKITPIFDMILAHNIADGTVINPKKGRLPYFGYRQFDKFYRNLYIEKIEDVFGKIVFSKRYFEESTRPYCPPVLSSLFFKCYNLNERSFLSKYARIPKEIFSKDKDHLLAILIAFIIDEGHIDSTHVFIKLRNEGLISDLKKICDTLKYKSKSIYGKCETKDYGYLYILREGMKKLYKDYLLLRKKYPVVDMGRKGKKIKDSFKIYYRPIYKTKGNREIILNILKKEQLSVNQLASRINMTRQGIRFHIHNLIKDNKIKIVNKDNPNWIYCSK